MCSLKGVHVKSLRFSWRARLLAVAWQDLVLAWHDVQFPVMSLESTELAVQSFEAVRAKLFAFLKVEMEFVGLET